jgi:membrane-associated phospholipid phosphatase
VAMGLHYLSDIAGGALLGLAAALVVVQIAM